MCPYKNDTLKSKYVYPVSQSQFAHNVIFNVHTTSYQRYGRCIDFETTLCVCRDDDDDDYPSKHTMSHALFVLTLEQRRVCLLR